MLCAPKFQEISSAASRKSWKIVVTTSCMIESWGSHGLGHNRGHNKHLTTPGYISDAATHHSHMIYAVGTVSLPYSFIDLKAALLCHLVCHSTAACGIYKPTYHLLEKWKSISNSFWLIFKLWRWWSFIQQNCWLKGLLNMGWRGILTEVLVPAPHHHGPFSFLIY